MKNVKAKKLSDILLAFQVSNFLTPYANLYYPKFLDNIECDIFKLSVSDTNGMKYNSCIFSAN